MNTFARRSAIIALALLAGTASAQSAGTRFVYLNLATEERVVSEFQARSGDPVIWGLVGDGQAIVVDDPARSPASDPLGRPALGSALVSGGDLRTPLAQAGQPITGVEFAYAISAPADPTGEGVIGLSLDIQFFENLRLPAALGAAGARSVATITVQDLAGNWAPSPALGGWTYSLDLEGTSLPFVLADASNGSADANSDGFPDFAYSFRFSQLQDGPKGVTTLPLARPATAPGGTGNATGSPNAIDVHSGSPSAGNYLGTLTLNPAASLSGSAKPYSTVFIALSGPCGASADYDRSGFVDSDDFVFFAADFAEGCTAAGAPGLLTPGYVCLGNADFDASGFVDSDDFTAFVKSFDAGCSG
jgi:hypothetical protein